MASCDGLCTLVVDDYVAMFTGMQQDIANRMQKFYEQISTL